MKRIGNPSDIANAVEFLLSQLSSLISGQTLLVDVGISNLNNKK
jgi:NAD(P)-dependent dehydrogenase (short-subunit alcohol dehydrogenase family)